MRPKFLKFERDQNAAEIFFEIKLTKEKIAKFNESG
jgi:hypothetical protein